MSRGSQKTGGGRQMREDETRHWRKQVKVLDWNEAEVLNSRPRSFLTRHHRQARSNGGTRKSRSGRDNFSVVPANHHEAWHLLFGNREVWEIADIINEVWLDPDFRLVVEEKKR